MKTLVTTLTERGQASLPASLRKEMGLRPGNRLRWQKLSSREVRLLVESGKQVAGPKAMLGFAKTFRRPRRTADWMRDLRAGEKSR
jgi:bifunctional DNA-binding transcriptional regulator/antitoxin component of YhaV-PrlF toxin-antitoxin module